MNEELKTTEDTQSAEQIVESIGNPEKQPIEAEITPEKEPEVIPVESDKERNFKIIREKAKRAEGERDEALRRLQEFENARATPVPEEDSLAIDNDSYVEGKHLKTMHKEMRRMQQEISQYKQQSTVSTAELRLKSEFPDFDSIVSKDNIELLNDLYPDIANTVRNSNADIYGKAVTAYTLIKKLGIVSDDKSFDADKRKILENAAKPKPLASIKPQKGDSPLAHSTAFTDTITEEEKKTLFKEMMESKKRVG